VFADNNFASFGDRYDEGQKYLTDVGFTDVTFAANGRTKTVTTYNVNDYMPAGLIRIREKLQDIVEFTKTPDESQVKALAEAWIKGAPTYTYDGSASSSSITPGRSHSRSGTYSLITSRAAMQVMVTGQLRTQPR